MMLVDDKKTLAAERAGRKTKGTELLPDDEEVKAVIPDTEVSLL